MKKRFYIGQPTFLLSIVPANKIYDTQKRSVFTKMFVLQEKRISYLGCHECLDKGTSSDHSQVENVLIYT